MTERTDKTTNEQIADLVLSQTYEERVQMAEYLADCAKSWMESGGVPGDLDYSYFSSLLAGWAGQVSSGSPSDD